jgi:hypothetical protein
MRGCPASSWMMDEELRGEKLHLKNSESDWRNLTYASRTLLFCCFILQLHWIYDESKVWLLAAIFITWLSHFTRCPPEEKRKGNMNGGQNKEGNVREAVRRLHINEIPCSITAFTRTSRRKLESRNLEGGGELHGMSPRANYTDRAMVSVTDPYGCILGFLDRSRYFSIK